MLMAVHVFEKIFHEEQLLSIVPRAECGEQSIAGLLVINCGNLIRLRIRAGNQTCR